MFCRESWLLIPDVERLVGGKGLGLSVEGLGIRA